MDASGERYGSLQRGAAYSAVARRSRRLRLTIVWSRHSGHSRGTNSNGTTRLNVVFGFRHCDKENHGWLEGPPLTVACSSFDPLAGPSPSPQVDGNGQCSPTLRSQRPSAEINRCFRLTSRKVECSIIRSSMGKGNAKTDLLPGTLDMLVLKILMRGHLHGYAIAQFIQQMSDDLLQVGRGFSVSGPPAPGTTRLDRGRMGAIGQQPARSVL